MEAKQYLCRHDERHPDYGDIDHSEYNRPGSGCACCNCFYGRHDLALEILRLQEIIENARLVLTQPPNRA